MNTATVLSFPGGAARLAAAAGSRPAGGHPRAIASNVVHLQRARRGRRSLYTLAGGMKTNPRRCGDAAGLLDHAGDDPLTLAELRAAIGEDRLVNYYQPQFDFRTGRITAVEALVRLVDASGHLVTPDRFIGQAEESGMIVALGRSVIRQACRDLALWRRRGRCLERVAINLSAHQLELDTVLLEVVEQNLDACNLCWADLEFEITERQALASEGAGMQTLQTLAGAGSRLALDDFGTGYSSLAYLSALDIRTVKLDRGMVGRLPDDRVTAGVVRHLLAMAKELDVDVVGEGVETRAQYDFLADLGCQFGQGYLVGRPMRQGVMAAFLEEPAPAC